MKYLREFKTENEYVAYRDGKDYLKPNVSISDDKSGVFYNFTPPPKTNGYEYVDLGLPSGTLWATCNVGADKPLDYGYYFHWGNVQGYTKDQVGKGSGQKKFDMFDDKLFSYPNYRKYTTLGESLELEDDAAHVNMGGDWHMPSPDQIQELIDNTTASSAGGLESGIKFTSKKDTSKFIIFPGAGLAENGSVYSGNSGYVLSSMLSTDVDYESQCLFYESSLKSKLDTMPRRDGASVRGVIGEIK